MSSSWSLENKVQARYEKRLLDILWNFYSYWHVSSTLLIDWLIDWLTDWCVWTESKQLVKLISNHVCFQCNPHIYILTYVCSFMCSLICCYFSHFWRFPNSTFNVCRMRNSPKKKIKKRKPKNMCNLKCRMCVYATFLCDYFEFLCFLSTKTNKIFIKITFHTTFHPRY